MRRLLLVCSLACSSGLACERARAPEALQAPDDAAALAIALAAAREFQRSLDEQLRTSDTSLLTAVEAFYLAPGQTLQLAFVEGRWQQREAEPELVAQASAEALDLRLGASERRFEGQGVLALDDEGRWTLELSRQEDDWRVLVHDRAAAAKRGFAGIEWFPVAADFIVSARFIPAPERTPKLLQTSRGVTKTLYLAGVVRFELADRQHELQAFGHSSEGQPGEPLLIPFKDATTGESSYAAGRYLELEAPAGAELVLDFNRAINPYCAYSGHYNCPLPPQYNNLDVAITAGAKAPH